LLSRPFTILAQVPTEWVELRYETHWDPLW
jgi:hypothetical protein